MSDKFTCTCIRFKAQGTCYHDPNYKVIFRDQVKQEKLRPEVVAPVLPRRKWKGTPEAIRRMYDFLDTLEQTKGSTH